MLDPTTSHYEGTQKEKKREEGQNKKKKKKKETGTSVVERLVDRNYYFFGFYNVQSYALHEYS